MNEILRTLYAWFCGCGDSGFPQTDKDAVKDFGQLHQQDCTGEVTIRIVEPL